MRFRSPIFCAIDRPDVDGARGLVQAIAPSIGGLKLGLEFMTAAGPEGVRSLASLDLPLFLDLKFHDIPNTVAGAVRSASRLGASMLTVHAGGGLAMLRAARAAADERAERPWLLGVTVLTSLDQADLTSLGIEGTVENQVLRLADLSASAGLDGLICSPLEIRPLRERFGDALKLVVPGIRPEGVADADQRRTLSPSAAMAAGADILVIGRAITAAPVPADAAAAIAAGLGRAQAA